MQKPFLDKCLFTATKATQCETNKFGINQSAIVCEKPTISFPIFHSCFHKKTQQHFVNKNNNGFRPYWKRFLVRHNYDISQELVSVF